MICTEGRVLTGICGTATEVVMTGPPPRPDMEATLATWFLHCPDQSPAWSNYLLSVIHLRPIDGVEPADIRVAKATHEVMLLALNPDADPVPTDHETWKWLTPFNVCEQVELPGDDEAIALLSQAARAVVDGVLPAEPALAGAVEPWRTVLMKDLLDAMELTVKLRSDFADLAGCFGAEKAFYILAGNLIGQKSSIPEETIVRIIRAVHDDYIKTRVEVTP